MEYNKHEYDPTGSRVGQHFELSHNPEISGEIVGQNGDDWLVRMTVPYGPNSQVHVVIHEQVIAQSESHPGALPKIPLVEFKLHKTD